MCRARLDFVEEWSQKKAQEGSRKGAGREQEGCRKGAISIFLCLGSFSQLATVLHSWPQWGRYSMQMKGTMCEVRPRKWRGMEEDVKVIIKSFSLL